MTEKEDLFTDYALQLFVTYINEDVEGMKALLQSFSDNAQEGDEFFMPGLVYGLLYHFATMTRLFCDATGGNVEDLMIAYGVDYAMAREELLGNALLNVKLARQHVDEIREILSRFSDEDFI